MTPHDARAAFLWQLTTPEQIMAAATTPELRVAAAKRLGVSLRTVQRHAGAFLRCPCACCLTLVRGGGVCQWCRKSGHA